MPFLAMLEGTVNNPDVDSERNKDTQDMIAYLLQVILVKVGHTVDTETSDKIVQLLVTMFQSLKKVTENGLIAYSGLCQGVKERVNVKDMGQYILYALESVDEGCARVACGVISDIAAAHQEKVELYLTSFVPQLLKILTGSEHDRQTKLQALCCLGDLCIYAGVPFIKMYLCDTMRILESAGELSLSKASFSEDPDTLEYLTELQGYIMETYSALISSCAEANQQEAALVSFMPKLFFFLQQKSAEQDLVS